VTDLRLASKVVDWFLVHEFVVSLLDEAGSGPRAGSPLWAALDDTDPRKLAAVLEDGVRWALRLDTLQEEMAQTSREISQMENWNTQRRRMFNHTRRIPRKKAS
jgi:hypothetical protein